MTSGPATHTAEHTATSFREGHRGDDAHAHDPRVAASRPPALTADGKIVSGAEIEAAAELSRLPLRLGLRRTIDGFILYRVYARMRRLRGVEGRNGRA